MSHLDDGMIHALLDGEIPSAELPPIQAHLGACAECRARLAEEQELLETSDRLIDLIEVPAASSGGAPKGTAMVGRTWPRNLAWAATLVLAVGLGYSARGSMPAGQFRVPSAPETVLAGAPEPAASAETAPALLDAPQDAAKMQQSSPPPAAPLRTERRGAVVLRDKAGQTATRERRVAKDSAGAAGAAGAANLAAAAPQARKVDSIARPAAAPSPTVGQLTAPPRRLGDTQLRLDEVVVSGVAERAAKLSSVATPVPITFPDAVRKLGGSLRLIEGLLPERLETMGNAVRVVYLTGFGELVLSQQLDDGKVRYTLIAPRGFPSDSLEKLRARVRE